MDSIRKKLAAIIPEYSLFPLILSVTVNMAVYGGTRMIAHDWHHYNIESPLDRLLPFWPPSVVIYLGCYLFWIVNYILIARQGKKEVYQFFAADLFSRIICMVIYLGFPTTNVRPVLETEGFWNHAMAFLYSIDAADNLFPSIHCLVSWFCYAGLRGRKDIPLWYHKVSCILAVSVCISTLTTKQHVLIDVAGGVLLAELSLWLGKKSAVRHLYEKILPKRHRTGLSQTKYLKQELSQSEHCQKKGGLYAEKEENNF